MGRFISFILCMGACWFLMDAMGLSMDPRGVGTTINGREVIRDADQVEARFSMVGSLNESYMLFGGDVQQRRNSIAHATAAGLPIFNARVISSAYPDFHMCSSRGAKQAMNYTKTLSFVAADRAALNTLIDAVNLFKERSGSGGERTCISVTGAPIALESVRIQPDGKDITREVGPALNRTEFILARGVQIQDCRPLLR